MESPLLRLALGSPTPSKPSVSASAWRLRLRQIDAETHVAASTEDLAALEVQRDTAEAAARQAEAQALVTLGMFLNFTLQPVATETATIIATQQAIQRRRQTGDLQQRVMDAADLVAKARENLELDSDTPYLGQLKD